MSESPKLFISYSWTSPSHEKWVLSLAEELVENGIFVIIDKWHLKHGHDANAFMEQMVTDASVNKVLLVCDARYVEKSNARTGGAGTEAQIITPQLYARREQEKFVAAVREKYKDGEPCVPVFYKGRIFFDLSDDAKYVEEFEGIVRWAWDEPAYVMPPLGKRPTFLDVGSSSVKAATLLAFRRAQEVLRTKRENFEGPLQDYLNVFLSELEKFRMENDHVTSEEWEEALLKNISDFKAYRNEMIEVFLSIAIYVPSIDCARVIHRFFEKMEPFMRVPDGVYQWNEIWFDNFRFIIHELFLYLIAILLKYERFDFVNYLLSTEYFTSDDKSNPMRPFTVFGDYMPSLANRDARLRHSSTRAELLKERCQALGVEFRNLMAADFVLYLRALGEGYGLGWEPHTLKFIGRNPNPIEIFARSKSKSYFMKVAPMIGVANKDELQDRIDSVPPSSRPRWDFMRLNISQLARLGELATSP
ncbi:toll/interleukin-1 receptor domain-containing protein [Aquabacter sp. P-9]|uniref:toll/interleukin-1 receptor domain-containing protein n=1 Tax=Aquabacter sediminis TaxID=3029197 RepID=UPI00237E4D2C|nr:SEFIR domain-containing protein [Aquabacter sp. P-9]MDE1571117.1 TIR domain-containing protein [Aquabacter sp. P-9]